MDRASESRGAFRAALVLHGRKGMAPFIEHFGFDMTASFTQGDITVDQAHRGYDVTVDENGKAW